MTALMAGILGGIIGIVLGVALTLGVFLPCGDMAGLADEECDDEAGIVRCPKCEAAWSGLPASTLPPPRNRVRWDGVKLIETCWRCGYSQVKPSSVASTAGGT